MDPFFAACGNGETSGDGTPALKLGTNRPLVFIQDFLAGFDRNVIWSWIKEASYLMVK